MDLDVKRMKLLREVAERGTITAAAQALAYTPSAVSQQLAVLERETGVKLLERQGRNVVLTPAGQVLVDHTADVVAALERAEAALARTATEIAGVVNLGTFESVVRPIVAPAITLLATNHPQIEVHVTQSDDIADLRRLRLGEVDVAVGQSYGFAPTHIDHDIETADLLTEPLFLAVPESEWPGGDVVDARAIEYLRQAPWIVDIHAPSGRAASTYYRHLGFEGDVRYAIADFTAGLGLVSHGLGVAVLPQIALTPSAPGIKTIRLDGAQWHRRLFVATRSGSSQHPAIRTLCDTMREVSADLATALGITVAA